jgi:hypothetical protein
MSEDALRDLLERAAEGLVYSSDVDRPFAFVRIANTNVPVARVTPDEVAALTDSLGATVAEISLEELLARHIERVAAHDRVSQGLIPRYQSLRDTLHRLLGTVRVFRLGQGEVRCVILGNDEDSGELVGLETLAIES